ncbi:MAG: hypothetical protein ACKOAD_05645 [Gammaproteobacteria bacterium]
MISLITLTACGFQMRGAFKFPASISQLYFSPYQAQDPLQQNIRRWLQAQQIRLQAFQPEFKQDLAFIPHLEILEKNFEEKSLAINAQGQNLRSLLELNIKYKLSYKKTSFENKISLAREFTQQPNAILVNNTEKTSIENQLWQDAATQLLNQIGIYLSSDHAD